MTRRFAVRWGVAALAIAIGLAGHVQAEPPADLATAQRLLQEGKHAEAEEAFASQLEAAPVEAAIGLARCQRATGHRDQARQTLESAFEKQPRVAGLPAELARLAYERGDYPAAEALVRQSLELDQANILAHYVRAELLTAQGKLPEANADYEWLVEHYNASEVDDPDELHWIGLGAAQFARWNRLSDQFGFLVNEFYPELVEAHPENWAAHYESGRLFAEKYNDGEADKAFKAALVLNPNAAETLVASGTLALDAFEVPAALAACEQALAINGELLAAHHLRADIHLANFDPRAAAGVLHDALKLNPVSEQTLGRLAAAYLATDGVHERGPATRFGKLVAEVDARNPHAGEFYVALGDALDRLRRWPQSAEFYREATRRMPQLVEPAGKLGLVLMRLGEEDEARKVLDLSFEADPFNVRVKNSLAVLEVLDGYETLETEHFLLRHDPSDKLLVRYMGEWLEEVYPSLVKQFGFEPPQKSLFEVFRKARNTDGHGWFSARMAGVPRIHPIGACAGKIVALQSPSEAQGRFNWARVLKHEFVHVINLQQTDFNIPHWFTEALAVLNEGYPRPQEWNELLAERLAADKLFDLDTINLGFIRPHSSQDWTLAYCQAELYAEYLLKTHGPDSLAKMLTAYRDNLTTAEALPREFGVSQPDFERGYRQYVEGVVAELPAGKQPAKPASPAELQQRLAENPRDAAALAELAQVQLDRKNYAEARRRADAALAVEPKNQLAHYVRARLHLLVGENREALERLTQNLDRQRPQENLLALLAGLKLRSEDFAGAAELYELGSSAYPGSDKWLKSLATVYLKSENDEKLRPILKRLAEADPDELAVRMKLAQLAAARQDWPAAERWSREGLHIQVEDATLHAGLGEALAGQGRHAAAAAEFAVAVELQPDAGTWRIALARALIRADQKDAARAALSALLEREADHAEAKQLLKTLE